MTPVLGDPTSCDGAGSWSSCHAPRDLGDGFRGTGRALPAMASARWVGALHLLRIISARCSSCPARAWMWRPHPHIGLAHRHPICSTAASCTATAKATSREIQPGAMKPDDRGPAAIAHFPKRHPGHAAPWAGQKMLGLAELDRTAEGFRRDRAPRSSIYAAGEPADDHRARLYRAARHRGPNRSASPRRFRWYRPGSTPR